MTKRRTLPLLCLVVSLAVVAPSAHAADKIPGQYIVVLEDDADVAAVAADHKRLAKADVLDTYGHALKGYVAKLSTAGLARIEADPRVASVTQDEEGVAVLAKPGGGGGATQPAQATPTGVNRIDADLSSTLAGDKSGETDANVAIFDTGIQTNHPDLNVVGGVNCLGATSKANDGTLGDQYGHGTHVAGIVGARDNTIGVVGVVPGARLWSIRTGDGAGGSSTSAQLCGIDWLTANGPALGIKVVNASVGLFGKMDDGNCGATSGDALQKAICRSTEAGLLWVFAAGNTTGDLNQMPGAGYDSVLAVTAMGDGNGVANVPTTSSFSCTTVSGAKGTYTDDKHTSWSRYAISAADRAHTVAAPGACIKSTYKASGYGFNNGTSMASPHAAGVAALCYAALQCTGTPGETITKLVADAQAASTANTRFGFTGDPLRPINGTAYYGHLIKAGY
jgi:subtilisin family serine protease